MQNSGLVLAGAVGKGAFHAGVLTVLSERALPVTSIVGTSAGALSGAVYAAGIASGYVAYAAQVITDMWLDDGGFCQFVAPSTTGLLTTRGLSSTARVQKMVLEAITRVMSPPVDVVRSHAPNREVKVGVVATDLHGHQLNEPDDMPPLTTFEQLFAFGAEEFASATGRTRVAQAAAASASFPLLFVPPKIDGVAYIDGGAVNNAPISYALDLADIERVIVVSAQPARADLPRSLNAIGLLNRLVDILINERLSRDLDSARRINVKLAQLERLFRDSGASPELQRDVIALLGWEPVDLVEVRPETELEGDALSGFGSRRLREAYIAAGRRRAQELFPAPKVES